MLDLPKIPDLPKVPDLPKLQEQTRTTPVLAGTFKKGKRSEKCQKLVRKTGEKFREKRGIGMRHGISHEHTSSFNYPSSCIKRVIIGTTKNLS